MLLYFHLAKFLNVSIKKYSEAWSAMVAPPDLPAKQTSIKRDDAFIKHTQEPLKRAKSFVKLHKSIKKQ